MDLTWLQLTELIFLGTIAGGVGSMTGIGGGLVITPVLTLAFGVPIHQAIATSLCCVIATSTGAAARYVQHRLSDIRLGMTLELATTLGAVGGSMVAGWLSREALAVLFAALLTYAGSTMVRRAFQKQVAEFSAQDGYEVKRLSVGMVGSGAAGVVSGMLGVGGGVIKVPLMYLAMGVPFKVATATSNLMIGVTAAASAFIYYARGDMRPVITAPTAVGVFVGASVGAHLMRRTPSRWLVMVFSAVVFYFATLMVWKALQGGFAR
jgi:uncharacterized membrane protein YfcA